MDIPPLFEPEEKKNVILMNDKPPTNRIFSIYLHNARK